jgi:hypothetical protein
MADKAKDNAPSAEAHAALQSEVAAMRARLAQMERDHTRLQREANVQGVKVTQGVPSKLVVVMPGNTVVTPDGVQHEEGDEFVYPWGPSADEMEGLGHIQILNHDASDHPDSDAAKERWEVKANA